MIKAWRTSALGINPIVLAETRGKARWQTIKHARDVGYGVEFKDVNVVRCQELDGVKLAANKAWDPSYCFAIMEAQ